MIALPELVMCPSVDNLARVLNKYLDDVTLLQKFIIKVRIAPLQEEAEQIYDRFLQLKSLCNHSTRL